MSLTTSTMGSEVGVRGQGSKGQGLAIKYKDKSQTCRMTCGLYNPQKHVAVVLICKL